MVFLSNAIQAETYGSHVSSEQEENAAYMYTVPRRYNSNNTQKNNKTSPEESGVQILLTSFQLPLMHCGVRDHLQQHDGDLVENCRGDKVMLHKLSESCGR